MGLFNKKNCAICNEKVGLLGGLKLKDGHLCKECKNKLSPFFTERKESTIEDVKKQLEYREENYKLLDKLEINKIYGEFGVILIDEKNKKFVAVRDTGGGLFSNPKKVTSIDDVKDQNPDIIDLKDVEDVEVKIIQTNREEKQTVNGQQVSYNPKHYTYMIGFNIIIKVKHPYIKEMRIDIKSGTVQIYNEGLRKQDDYIAGFVKDKLGLKRVENKAVHYDNLTIHNLVEKAMQVMPDYSYGFKCSLKNYDRIKEYAYYLALCDEIRSSLLNK
ncbi:MAG: DUF4428 domain-containing protein [Bacilli bacterium]|nr:DUF4428 domain-containing protein [Bacilli bacterium]